MLYNYVIVAQSINEADDAAQQLCLKPEEWLFIVDTFNICGKNCTARIYRKNSSPTLTVKETQKLTEEQQFELFLNNQFYVRLILCSDFWVASRYAGKRSWWLHAWNHINIPDLDEPAEYSLYLSI